MQISALTSYIPATLTPSAASIKKTDEAFAELFSPKADDPAAELNEIAGNGIEGMMKWKVKQLEKELAAKALASRNLTTDQVAAMPDKERVSLEQQIIKEVAEKIKEAINEQMKRQSGQIAIINGTSQSLAGSLDIMA